MQNKKNQKISKNFDSISDCENDKPSILQFNFSENFSIKNIQEKRNEINMNNHFHFLKYSYSKEIDSVSPEFKNRLKKKKIRCMSADDFILTSKQIFNYSRFNRKLNYIHKWVKNFLFLNLKYFSLF